MNRKTPNIFSALDSHFYSWSSLALLALLFLALAMLSTFTLRGVRLDLTEHKLYTISTGTRHILAGLQEPLHMRLFYSEQLSSESPQLVPIRAYYQRVRDLLNEFRARAGDRLEVSFINVAPFSEEEDQAASYGLQSVPVGDGDSFYFGLAGTNAVDGLEVIPFFHPNRERFLEYDLARLIYRLDQAKKPRIGVLSSISLDAGFDPATQRSRPGLTAFEQLREFYEVVTVDPTVPALPEDLAALILVHPKDLSAAMEYTIDQFALAGGRLLVFVDPYTEQGAEAPYPGMPPIGGSSDLPRLFKAWGVKYDQEHFIADLRYGLEVNMGAQGTARHIAILGLDNEAIAGDDIVTANLNSVNLASAGELQAAAEATLDFTPLLWTSANAAPLPVTRLQALGNPRSLLEGFHPDQQIHVLAARLGGEVKSAFPDGKPDDSPLAGEPLTSGRLDAIVIADSDLLADAYWVQRQNFFGQTLLNPFAGNGDLLLNAAENLLGNADLISIRPRELALRPFTLVENLRVAAETRFRDTEEQLEQELDETERKLTALQQTRSDGDLTVLSEAQKAEVQRFIDRKLEVRRELRKVRSDLNRDIRVLGNVLKGINIGLIPFIVAIFGGIYFTRRWRHRPARAAGGQG